ncbi:MAG: MmgE/PrpD family protein [Candidatus Ornithomonoglobus sp.]
MERNLTDELIYYLEEKKLYITEAVKDRAKQCLLDYVGVAYAGAKVNRNIFIQELPGAESGKCSVLGYKAKTDMKTAAFINGFNAHTVELDDGHRMGMIHLGAVIISAVIAAAENDGLSMDDVLRGIILGYEAAVRTAVAIQPAHKKAGFHTTGTCGTIGAAVGAAYARGYDTIQLKSAVSAAATSAAGLLEIQEDNSGLKPYNAGHAAMSGAAAAQLGRAAVPGPDDILYGGRGMFRLLGGAVNHEGMLADKEYFEIEKIYVKPYAACRHCHSAMEAAIILRNKYNISPDNIDRINIYTYGLAIKGHSHKDIKGVGSAKLSMPYSVAAAYILGTGGLEAYSDNNISREDIKRLMDKVSIYEKEEFNGLKNGQRIAEVCVVTNDKNVITERVDFAKGDPENPMNINDIKDKFRKLMEWSGHADRITLLTDTIINKS